MKGLNRTSEVYMECGVGAPHTHKRDKTKLFDTLGAAYGVCQRCCPPISCGVSDLRDADFIFRVEPDGSGGLPVSDFA